MFTGRSTIEITQRLTSQQTIYQTSMTSSACSLAGNSSRKPALNAEAEETTRFFVLPGVDLITRTVLPVSEPVFSAIVRFGSVLFSLDLRVHFMILFLSVD